MKKFNTIIDIAQVYLTEDELKSICNHVGYIDLARKFSVSELFKFFIAAASGKWESFRAGVDYTESFGIPKVDHSTVSKKASDVPFEVFKMVFDLILNKLNRRTQRTLKLKKVILAVDSTTISVGKGRMKWAEFKGEKSAIKLHVGYNVSTNLPDKVVETIGLKHDGPIGEAFQNKAVVLVEDRAYAKISRFDKFIREKQSFVIRIKDNFTIVQARKLRSSKVEESNVDRDITCYLGKNNNRSQSRIRVVTFIDDYGHNISVATDMMKCTPQLIAEIYRERWAVEQFFRFIKQNLNVKRIFGTSKNAVYSQMFCALITYIFIQVMYKKLSVTYPYFRLSRIQFLRQLSNDTMNNENLALLHKELAKYVNPL